MAHPLTDLEMEISENIIDLITQQKPQSWRTAPTSVEKQRAADCAQEIVACVRNAIADESGLHPQLLSDRDIDAFIMKSRRLGRVTMVNGKPMDWIDLSDLRQRMETITDTVEAAKIVYANQLPTRDPSHYKRLQRAKDYADERHGEIIHAYTFKDPIMAAPATQVQQGGTVHGQGVGPSPGYSISKP